MVRRYYSLPSLNALAAFESAARHLSLTKAAEELNVTPGAISKQVRMLEDELGGPLFVRRHRALELTREGETIAIALRDGFERMAATFKQVRMGGALNVTIGSTMALAQLWLMPRLGAFWNSHQDIVIDHVISDNPHGLDRPDVDLRFRYGDGEWPGEIAVKLYDDRIHPVASPDFVREHDVRSLEDLAELQLLSVEGVDWTWTTWASFLQEAGGVSPRRLNVRRFNSYVIALQAARSGQGVALGWASLVEPLIRSGDLERLTDAEIGAPQSYFVTWSAHRPLSRQAEILKDWLLTLD
jgi:DNA-binding transcriptional LysR family regulator